MNGSTSNTVAASLLMKFPILIIEYGIINELEFFQISDCVISEGKEPSFGRVLQEFPVVLNALSLD